MGVSRYDHSTVTAGTHLYMLGGYDETHTLQVQVVLLFMAALVACVQCKSSFSCSSYLAMYLHAIGVNITAFRVPSHFPAFQSKCPAFLAYFPFIVQCMFVLISVFSPFEI